jgi:hypothetical protein
VLLYQASAAAVSPADVTKQLRDTAAAPPRHQRRTVANMADENVEFLLSIIDGQLSRDEAVQLLKVRKLRVLSRARSLFLSLCTHS